MKQSIRPLVFIACLLYVCLLVFVHNHGVAAATNSQTSASAMRTMVMNEERDEAQDPSAEALLRSPTTVVYPHNKSDPFEKDSSVIGPKFYRQVHLFELPNSNNVLSCAGSGNLDTNNANQIFTCSVYNWSTGQRVSLKLPSDWFCGAGVFLPDGNLLFAGGTAQNGFPSLSDTKHWLGSSSTYLFNSATFQITKLGDMNEPRWYNNLVRDWYTDRIYTFGGLNNGTFSNTWEVMEPGMNNWSLLPWTHKDYSYDDYKVLDASHLFFTGARASGITMQPQIINLDNGAVTPVNGLRALNSRQAAASLSLYPAQNHKIAVFGGGVPARKGNTSTNKVDVINFSTWPSSVPAYSALPDMPAGVRFVLASNLPNGQVFVTGGTKQWRTGSVRWAGIYTPWSNRWTVLPPARVARNYHSNIYTRADGKVITFGGNPTRDQFESRSEIFSPWYEYRPAPTIRSVSSSTMTRGQSYDVAVAFPKGEKFGYVTLDSARSTTHSSSDTGTGLFRLPAVRTATGVRVTVPAGQVIPTGYYKLAVVTGGPVTKSGASGRVPSQSAVWIRIVS